MTNRGFDGLGAVSDDELERGLRLLLREGARTEAGIVAHLAEVEERKLHLRAGYPSMFQYCLEQLRLSENEAFHRIVAARLAAAYPAILELLEAREIHLSAICLLRRHLTRENHRELLAEACGKSKRQVEELVARRFPGSVSPQAPAAKFTQVNADCYRVELYFTRAQKQKLELARDLVSHANPTGDWGIVMERAVDALAEKIQGRRFAKLKNDRDEAHREVRRETHVDSAKPRARRHIPNPVRRTVAARDDMSCSFTSESGRRCGARAFSQFDHLQAWARGGDETCENLRILCAAHNRLLAEQQFGTSVVKRGRERRQSAPNRAAPNRAAPNRAAPSRVASPPPPAQPVSTQVPETIQPVLGAEKMPKTAA